MFGVHRARQSGMIFLFSKGIFEIMCNIHIGGFTFMVSNFHEIFLYSSCYSKLVIESFRISSFSSLESPESSSKKNKFYEISDIIDLIEPPWKIKDSRKKALVIDSKRSLEEKAKFEERFTDPAPARGPSVLARYSSQS